MMCTHPFPRKLGKGGSPQSPPTGGAPKSRPGREEGEPPPWRKTPETGRARDPHHPPIVKTPSRRLRGIFVSPWARRVRPGAVVLPLRSHSRSCLRASESSCTLCRGSVGAVRVPIWVLQRGGKNSHARDISDAIPVHLLVRCTLPGRMLFHGSRPGACVRTTGSDS